MRAPRFNPIQRGIKFRRQNLTNNVWKRRLKSIPALKESNIYNSRTPTGASPGKFFIFKGFLLQSEAYWALFVPQYITSS